MGLEVRIASPCSANWNQMAGDDRVRYCPECRRNVYNFSSMTEAEVKRLVAQSEGRLCGRFYQRADGTMLAKNCPVGFRASILCATQMATAALAAVVTAIPSSANAMPHTGRTHPPLLLQIELAKPSISLVAVDETGAFIPHADVTFRHAKTGEQTTAKTDGDGALQMTSLAAGEYQVTVTVPGFRPETVAHVEVPTQKVLRITLRPEGMAMMGAIVEIIPTDTAVATPLSSQLTLPPTRLHRFFSRIRGWL
jgi:Carboxypeptidase regulatory-like domain